MTCPTSAPSGGREREICGVIIFTLTPKTRKESSFFSSSSEEKASMVLKFMKNYSSIPTRTLLRRTTLAKSSASKFFPFNKKAFRGIDYFSSFLFLLIRSSKKKLNLLLRLMFPQQMLLLTVETYLIMQPA